MVRSVRALVATATLALAAVALAPAGQADSPPGSQPYPGYTISAPALKPLVVDGQRTRVVQGVRKHAAYDIEIPRDWNGQLVMWAHGYRGNGSTLSVDVPSFGLRRTFLEHGYAWAASSYARNGYDVASGITTTYDLARYAALRLPRQPERTYVAGASMGGHVIGRSLEQYPRFYAGAMPMCGVLGDHQLFDWFLSYNLVAQDLADHPAAYPPRPDYLTADVPAIEKALGIATLTPGGPDTTNARGAQLRDVATRLTGGERPGADQAFAYWKDFPFTLYQVDNGGSLAENPGRLAQNLDTDYRPNRPARVNRTVQRVAPRDAASRTTNRLTQVPTIQGRPDVPVLSLHGLGDYYVPFDEEQIYARDVAANHQQSLLVQRAIREAGHCEFTPTEAARGFADLTRWVESRDAKGPVLRPEGDDVLKPAAVADPSYGCRFTDPAAYDDPKAYPTRSLYPRCPAG
ncbi:alpha/beta hydrolase [Marmoricola endophyticus]|uniref:Alpha/beta hydrolase n=1 Tax=Marmoricola endophyticus TaxID=2040280 RepID=A0A917BK68_9ACTN|nr:alpha/beta hydrolase [Marmoricola endophyticus]GGF46907.1 alpha/beta hydrolase [Marmoricola endophyticus]